MLRLQAELKRERYEADYRTREAETLVSFYESDAGLVSIFNVAISKL